MNKGSNRRSTRLQCSRIHEGLETEGNGGDDTKGIQAGSIEMDMDDNNPVDVPWMPVAIKTKYDTTEGC